MKSPQTRYPEPPCSLFSFRFSAKSSTPATRLWVPVETVERKYEPLTCMYSLSRVLSPQTPQNVGDQPRRDVALSRMIVPLIRSVHGEPLLTNAILRALYIASTRKLFDMTPL